MERARSQVEKSKAHPFPFNRFGQETSHIVMKVKSQLAKLDKLQGSGEVK
jgi:hypothetical protein